MRSPRPAGTGDADHSELAAALDAVSAGGLGELPPQRERLDRYGVALSQTDPDSLSRDGALAYWLNLYNAGALALAATARASGESTVLRVPGAFDRPWAEVAGERLSLHDIEHGKIRRFADPRVHGALVCGTASCPTLRFEPYSGLSLEAQLDDQMRTFMTSGGITPDKMSSVILLSRIFLWYGGDFARPRRMPTWLPTRKRTLISALTPWFDEDTKAWIVSARPRVAFHPYDWELACSVV